MQSDEKKIRIHLVSTSGGEPTVLECLGKMKTLENKHLLQYDDNGVKTSLKLDEKAVNILRSGGHSNHRLCVIGGEKTVGVMGDTPFTIIGKRGDWTFDNNEGEVRINYTLPDISNEPMDFNIRIKFSVVQ